MRSKRKPAPKQPDESPLPQHYTEPGALDLGKELPGWPGYRTQPGHSGLDPVESYTELGHVLGICLRDLLFIRVRTQNPLAWIGMAVAGFFFLAPMLTTMVYLSSLDEAALPLVVFTFIPAILGLLIWTNLGLGIVESVQRRSTSTR